MFDKVSEEVHRLISGYRASLLRKLKDTKGFGSGSQNIDSVLEGIEYVTMCCMSNGSLLISLDEPLHPLPALISHHTVSVMANALSITEKHTAQIEVLRRRIALAPEPSAATRRVTYLQGIAKAAEAPPNDIKETLDDRARRGWDTNAVEDLYSAILSYVREMGNLLEDLLGIKDIMDRILDKLSVHPPIHPN